MSESRISIGYLDKDKIQIDLNRTEGTETISLDDLCTIIERHQWLLEEAYEQAREKRIDREYKANRYGPDLATSYMMDLIEENSRSDADPGL